MIGFDPSAPPMVARLGVRVSRGAGIIGIVGGRGEVPAETLGRGRSTAVVIDSIDIIYSYSLYI